MVLSRSSVEETKYVQGLAGFLELTNIASSIVEKWGTMSAQSITLESIQAIVRSVVRVKLAHLERTVLPSANVSPNDPLCSVLQKEVIAAISTMCSAIPSYPDENGL